MAPTQKYNELRHDPTWKGKYVWINRRKKFVFKSSTEIHKDLDVPF